MLCKKTIISHYSDGGIFHHSKEVYDRTNPHLTAGAGQVAFRDQNNRLFRPFSTLSICIAGTMRRRAFQFLPLPFPSHSSRPTREAYSAASPSLSTVVAMPRPLPNPNALRWISDSRLRICVHCSCGVWIYTGIMLSVVAGAIAVLFAAVVTTPADVLLTRMSTRSPQCYLETHHYMSPSAAFVRILKDEGFGSLWTGAFHRGMFYMPMIGLFFAAYTLANACVHAGDIDAIPLDVGVSPMQLDTTKCGFSLSRHGLLDMRMSCDGMSAADIVNTADESELADIIFALSVDRNLRRIARKIASARDRQPIQTTAQLADVVLSASRFSRKHAHPVTKRFQALRIAFIKELAALEEVLRAGVDILQIDGRLGDISFHSVEDRTAKRVLKSRNMQKAVCE